MATKQGIPATKELDGQRGVFILEPNVWPVCVYLSTVLFFFILFIFLILRPVQYSTVQCSIVHSFHLQDGRGSEVSSSDEAVTKHHGTFLRRTKRLRVARLD